MSANAATPLTRPNDRLRRRKAVNRGMELVAWIAAAIAVALLVLLVGSVAQHGASQLNWNLLTKAQVAYDPTVKNQGLANAFAGTLVIVGIAALMALPIGILIAIYVNEFAPRRIRAAVGFILDILSGVPAVVIGFFVYGLIVVSQGQSGLAGSFALSIMMLPFVARSTIEILALVPNSLREAGLGLGSPRWRTTLGIVLPQALGGILTGATLAVARVAGETAPLLFCSSIVGNGTSWNPLHALQTIPVAIFQMSESPYTQDHARAWSGGLVLILFILLASLSARWLATRSRRKLTRSS